MDPKEIIKRVIETGKVKIGSRSVSKAIVTAKPKLVILSSNCPKTAKEDIIHYASLASVPVYNYEGTSIELGEVCRKPFPISAMAIESPGTAKITQLVKEAKA